MRRIRTLCDETARSRPNPSCRLQNQIMFRIHKHNKHLEYRLIIPRQAELPSELCGEWTACELTDRIEAERREEIERIGYFLFRSERNEHYGNGDSPPLPCSLVGPRAELAE